jgi:hypothetical protein
LATEAWINARNGDGVVVARGGPARGYALFLQGGKPRFAIRSSNEVSTVGADQEVTGRWVHLAGVLTADKKLQLYVDGKLAATADGRELITGEPKQPLEIGMDDGGAVGDYPSPFGFRGLIDEVRVYYGTVSASDIEKHFSNPADASTQEATLVLHCSLDEGKATDASGNQNHGTVEGVVTAKGKFGDALKFTGVKRRRRPQLPHAVEYQWSHEIPLHVRAMVVAGKTLFIAGPPDVLDEEEAVKAYGTREIQAKLAQQVAALEGKQGALLWAVSAANGEKLAEYSLDALPVWDGMAAAGVRLYLSTRSGKVLCLLGR